MKIEKVLSKTKTPTTGLSWIQKVVCSLFNITPEIRFNFVIGLEVEIHPAKFYKIAPGCILLLEGTDCYWRVTKQRCDLIEIQNSIPILDFSIGNEVVPYANAFAEKSKS